MWVPIPQHPRVACTHALITNAQEVKLTAKDVTDDIAAVPGFSSYFSLPRKNVAYSGVATFCASKCTPVRAGELLD